MGGLDLGDPAAPATCVISASGLLDSVLTPDSEWTTSDYPNDFSTTVATGAHRQGGQKRRYKDTLKKSLKQLQINPATGEDLVHDRQAWIRSVKTVAEIYEANRITAAQPKQAARNSQAPWINTASAHAVNAHFARANQPRRTSSNSIQQQYHNINLCHTCLRPHDDDHPNH
ncbi:unnamed protein product [Schistocephalus solidus]|uniref:Uncharacterized protein n=1 Tax=Schistocephalus solidus TaxID=70667 RepID=A0A183TJ11_SCHSO|nr:unnamed protein product [Schistocephalus solidus]